MENPNEFINITPSHPGKVVDAFKDKVVSILEDVYDLLRLNTSIVMEEGLIIDMRNKLDELHNMVESEYNHV